MSIAWGRWMTRRLVVSMDDEEGAARVIAIDLASATQVELVARAALAFTVSPDGRFVVVWNMTFGIVPIEGGAVRPVSIDGSPEAWLR